MTYVVLLPEPEPYSYLLTCRLLLLTIPIAHAAIFCLDNTLSLNRTVLHPLPL